MTNGLTEEMVLSGKNLKSFGARGMAAKKIYLALILIFMYAPIAVMILFSFNASKSRGVWGGFSLRWYESLLSNSNILQDLQTTLIVAFLSALIATIIGTAAALGIYSMTKKKRNIIMQINNLPVLNPDIVTGVSLMILFTFLYNKFGIFKLGFSTLLLSHITFNIPYVILSVMPKLRQLDPNLYEAALDLGASPFTAYKDVILPQIKYGIVTGAIIAFTMSLDDFVISFFNTGSGVSTLSVTVYSMARRGINPEINALSTLLFAAVMVLLILINKRDSKELELF